MAEKPEQSSEEMERPTKEQVQRKKPAGEDARRKSQGVSLKSAQSLERLRDRIETAAHELKRLRDENQALSERIKELETRPSVVPHGTFLSLDHDPELLRRKISGFIEVIDRYLERERRSS